MISDKEYIRAWQGRVGSRTVHLNPESFNKEDLRYLTNQYDLVCKNININNKIIVDYGCGGGLFGIYLFRWEYNPKKYIGIDIANRCVNEARLNSMCWEVDEDRKTDVEIIEINPIQLIDFSLLKANIFIMLNVARYFPNINYVKLFFNRLNESNIKQIVFNFKPGENNSFRKHPYKTTYDIGNANTLTAHTIMGLLNNYEINKTKDLDKNDCFLFLKMKRKEKDGKTE